MASGTMYKKMMQQQIDLKIKPLLVQNGFIRYAGNKYVRERDLLAQFITFRVERSNLKSWAFLVPLFVPTDNYLGYGVGLCCGGSPAIRFLQEEYVTFGETDFSEEYRASDSLQQQHFEAVHLPNMGRFTAALSRRVLPELDRVSSLSKLVDIVTGPAPVLFGNSFDAAPGAGSVHSVTVAVYRCLQEEPKQAAQRLNLLEEMLAQEVRHSPNPAPFAAPMLADIQLLLASCQTGDKKRFLASFDEICDRQRKKYKLAKT